MGWKNKSNLLKNLLIVSALAILWSFMVDGWEELNGAPLLTIHIHTSTLFGICSLYHSISAHPIPIPLVEGDMKNSSGFEFRKKIHDTARLNRHSHTHKHTYTCTYTLKIKKHFKVSTDDKEPTFFFLSAPRSKWSVCQNGLQDSYFIYPSGCNAQEIICILPCWESFVWCVLCIKTTR